MRKPKKSDASVKNLIFWEEPLVAKESIEVALKRFDERYHKLKIEPQTIEKFGINLRTYMGMINSAIKNKESEEHLKKIVNDFLGLV